MHLTQSGIWVSIIISIAFALLESRPSRKIGPRDQNLTTSLRWAYGTFNQLITMLALWGLFGLWGAHHEALAFFYLMIELIFTSALSFTYYLFLTEDTPSK